MTRNASTRWAARRAAEAMLMFLCFASLGFSAPGWAQDTNEFITVTCELANYADGFSGNGWRIIPTNSGHVSVSGVVLRVVEPKEFAGQLLSFHFDGPPGSGYMEFYEPGLRYRGTVRRDEIGRLAFLCDRYLRCTELTQPLQAGTTEELGRLLRDRHWNTLYAEAIKKQFGDVFLFRVLYGYLTSTNHSSGWLRDQSKAAELLARLNPKLDVDIRAAVRDTLCTWDGSIKEWPLYLWRQSSRDQLVKVVGQLQSAKLSEAERETLEMWDYYLTGEEKDLVGWSKR